MNSRVKYKVWNEQSKKFMIVAKINFLGEYFECEEQETKEHFTFKISETKLLQYTGKKDFKDVEIFEGDKLIDSNDRLFVVYWSKALACFRAQTEFNSAIDLFTVSYICEVVGNIYSD